MSSMFCSNTCACVYNGTFLSRMQFFVSHFKCIANHSIQWYSVHRNDQEMDRKQKNVCLIVFIFVCGYAERPK